MTGGTGFFGRWLVESLLHANERRELGASVVLLSREPHAFARRAPHLAGSSFVTLVAGDVRTFEAPSGQFTRAAPASSVSHCRVASPWQRWTRVTTPPRLHSEQTRPG